MGKYSYSTEPLTEFLSLELASLLNGDSTPTDFIECFVAMEDALSWTRRKHVEEIFDRFVEEREELPPVATACLLAATGYFGSSAMDFVSTVTSAAMQTPDPERPWSRAVLLRAPLFTWLRDPSAIFGDTPPPPGSLTLWRGWCVAALLEASERAHHQGSQQWLTLLPVLEQLNARLARSYLTKRPRDRKPAQLTESFAAHSTALLDRVTALRAAAEPPSPHAEPSSREGGSTAADAPAIATFLARAGAGEQRLTLEEQMCRTWLSGLVRFAPTVDALAGLVADGSSYRACCGALDSIVPSLCSKLRGYYFAAAGELRTLTRLLRETRGLRAPHLAYQIAAAILENDETDDFLDSTLELLGTALSAPPAQAASSAAQDASAPIQPGTAAAAPAVVRAARSWLHRNFAQVPPPKKVWEPAATYGGGYGGYGYGYGGGYGGGYGAQVAGRWVEERQTAEERQGQRERCLAEALERVQCLMATSFFGSRPDPLLYELGRCYFLQGNACSALQALCSVALSEATEGGGDASESESFHSFCSPLQAWIGRKAAELVEAAVGADHVEKMLRVVCSAGMLRLPLSGLLLHTACLAVGGERPALARVLANGTLWERVMEVCHPWPGAVGAAPAPAGLTTILAYVTTLLKDLVAQLKVGTLELRSLHVVLKAPVPLPQLLSSLRLTAIAPLRLVDGSLLGEQQRALSRFDMTLQELRAYCSYWCTCGVPTQADELRAIVSRLTREYGGLTLVDAHTAFEHVEVLPHLPWLHSLRGSELFLRVWREAGRFALRKRREREASAMELAFAELAETLGLWEGGGDDDDDDDDNEGAGGAFGQDADGALAEEGGEPEEGLLETPLEQVLVVQHLLPEVRARWHALMSEIQGGGIALIPLSRAIGPLSDSQVGMGRLSGRVGCGAAGTGGWAAE